MKKILLIALIFLNTNVFASSVMPVGHANNQLYYRVGGGRDFALPPVSSTDSINLDTTTNLGLGLSCSAFNPALSIVNSINNLKDSMDNLNKDLLVNATGSLIQLPMYEFARSNPTLFAQLNNQLLAAHKKLEISTKSCEVVRDQIARGENPYQDWGTIAVNDQWKQKLTLISSGDADINDAKKEIDEHSGDDGVVWINGNRNHDGAFYAGGQNQPPVHVIADTVKAGYNVLLNRDLQSNDAANQDGSSSQLAHIFPTPLSAVNWITTVVGDQTITTCNDDFCKNNQGSMVGHGLLPWLTSCHQDSDNCIDTIRDRLGKLVTGRDAISKDNLERVSADGIDITPDAVLSIRTMDTTQQSIIVNKLAQEIALQRVIDKALIARNILSTGAAIPVIAANHPAEVIIMHAIANLDNDIRSLAFEGQIRRQMMSDTLSQVLSFANQQQRNAMNVSSSTTSPLMEESAISQGQK